MKKSLVLIGVLLLAGCESSYNEPVTVQIDPEDKQFYPHNASAPQVAYRIPDSAFRNPGNPERLLDKSSELVTMDLGSRGALNKIARTINQDPPTRAELNCNAKEAFCAEAKSIFAGRAIPSKFIGDGDSVTLVYERVVTRDCDSRFVDNSKNGDNLHPPSFGCSVVANTLQMVSDKKQVVDPSLTDFSDGEKAAQNYRRYGTPSKESTSTAGQSVLRTITTR